MAEFEIVDGVCEVHAQTGLRSQTIFARRGGWAVAGLRLCEWRDSLGVVHINFETVGPTHINHAVDFSAALERAREIAATWAAESEASDGNS